MMAKRLLGAALVLVIYLPIAIAGGWVFAVGLGIILAAALREFLSILNPQISTFFQSIAILCAFALTLARIFTDQPVFSALLAACVCGLSALALHVYRSNPQDAARQLVDALAGLLLIPFLGGNLLSLRLLPDGLRWLLFTTAVTWSSDVGAYLLGSALGKHFLAPRLSPKKTWEGFAGGTLFAVLAGLAFALIAGALGSPFSLSSAAILAVSIALVSPIGDLVNSLIKRHCGVKDTGSLIPGHGGIFDRFDTLLWAAPLTYFLLVCLGWA